MAGFAIEQKVLAETDCNALLSALSATSVRRSRAGARHLMGNPAVAELAADGELIAIAKAWLGKAAVPFRATLFEKSSQTNWLIPWHQDTALPLTAQSDSPGWGAWSKKEGILYAHAPAWALERVVALRVHLDPSEADNGPLRVLPGSHTAGVLTDREVLDRVAAGNPIDCMVCRGGVLAMRPLLIHSSSKARSTAARRVLHIEYADALDLSRRPLSSCLVADAWGVPAFHRLCEGPLRLCAS